MQITKLILRQYRNYEQKEFIFQPGLNVIVGENASGKTNLLEAILFLSTLYTYRTHNHRDLIRHGDQGMYMEGHFTGDQDHYITLKVYRNGRKEMRMNGKRCTKSSDILGTIPVVWFSPEDVRLIKGEPDIRRRWINFILSQTESEYQNTLKQYHRILVERNAALHQIQEGKLSPVSLSAWDEGLAKKAVVLIQNRERFINEIAPIARAVHERLAQKKEELTVLYRPSIDIRGSDDPYKYIITRLNDRRSAELVMGITLIGPHRDEIDIFFDGKSARSFGSQGQQRSAVLSLKRAEIVYIQKKLGVYPIGLFDDVLSELDDQRSQNFWDILMNNSTGIDEGIHRMQYLLSAVKMPQYIRNVKEQNRIEITKESEAQRHGTTPMTRF